MALLAALERRIGRVTCALFAGDPDAPRADMLSVGVARPLKRRRAGGVHAVGTGGASLVAALAALTAEGVLRDGVTLVVSCTSSLAPLASSTTARAAVFLLLVAFCGASSDTASCCCPRGRALFLLGVRAAAGALDVLLICVGEVRIVRGVLASSGSARLLVEEASAPFTASP